MTWNISEAVYRLSQTEAGDRPALIHGDDQISYRELVRRCTGIARWLNTLGLPENSHVGHYMRNSNAYMETFIGAGLTGMAHINVNYRYLEQELIELCVSLDIRVLVYDAEFADRVADIKDQLTETVAFIEVGPAPAKNDFAQCLSELYDHDSSDFERNTSNDHLMIIATGGTTGLPKGTMWRHEDLWFKQKISQGSRLQALDLPEHPANLDEHIANVLKLPEPTPFMPLSPLMHGAASLMAILMLCQGTPVMTMPGEKFDANQTLNLVKRFQVSAISIVGDAFAIPLTAALEQRADEGLFNSVNMLVSTGASLTEQYRSILLKHQPRLVLFDTLGSSEASGFAVSTPEAGVFRPLKTTRVFDDELNEVVPGSDTIGIAYSGGYSPIGYYKQPEKSGETFVTIRGERFVKTGDRCTVRDDGMLILLGRDSTVINTGGEKVYTVEVERALIEHPAISDALVVGLPHPRFGKMVVGVVEGPGLSSDNIDVAEIQTATREILADYKVPREIFAIDDLRRAPNGKPDYPFVTEYAEQQYNAEQQKG